MQAQLLGEEPEGEPSARPHLQGVGGSHGCRSPVRVRWPRSLHPQFDYKGSESRPFWSRRSIGSRNRAGDRADHDMRSLPSTIPTGHASKAI
jgi:hypothetical protein